MKTYPKIDGPSRLMPNLPCIAFHKFDGSNLRFEWNRKGGWNKYGTRWRLFDENDPDFGKAIPLFLEKWSEDLSQVFADNKDYRGVQRATCFFEYYGENSFAGWHDPNEDKTLTLIDVDIYKKGVIAPREFISNFSHLDSAPVIYEGNLNKQFVEEVRKMQNIEGVVAKGWHKNKQWMRKVKTEWWLEELKVKIKENPELIKILKDNSREQGR